MHYFIPLKVVGDSNMHILHMGLEHPVRLDVPGLVGFMPVFEDREACEAFYPNTEIVTLEVADHGISD